MPRYIDADELKHELCIRQHMLNADTLWKTLEIMDAQPTADVVERKKGIWFPRNNAFQKWFRCSECAYRLHELKGTKFCPNCGADMREEKQDE